MISYGSITISNINEPFTVILTNESQQFSVSSDRKVTNTQKYETDVIVYQGINNITNFSIGNIIAPDIFNITVAGGKISISVTEGKTFNTDSGVISIPVILNGEMITKSLSWSCVKNGVSANFINIVPTSQTFKSMDGINYNPNEISLSPIIQGEVLFDKWEYSLDGGNSWITATNKENGMTISTKNDINNVLTINSNSTLFNNASSITFKCLTNNSTCFDMITIIRLTDSSYLEIGGTNLLRNTSSIMAYDEKINNWTIDKIGDTIIETDKSTDSIHIKTGQNQSESGLLSKISNIEFKKKQKYTFSCAIRAFFNSDNFLGARFYYINDAGNKILSEEQINWANLVNNNSFTRLQFSFTIPSDFNEETNILYLNICGSTDAYIRNFQLERGTIASDWSPSPFDDNSKIESLISITDSITSTVDKIEKNITNKIWEEDINNYLNNYDNTKGQAIREKLTQTEQNQSGITQKVLDIETITNDTTKEVTDLSKTVSEVKQDAKGFKQTVENTYMKQEDFNILKTSYTQLSDKFSWIVESKSSETSLILTDSLISAITKQFIIKDSNDSITIIEGGKIKSNSITTDMLSTTVITSSNYETGIYTDGAGYSKKGTFIDLENGMIHTPTLYTDRDGNSYVNGTVYATNGEIGGCSIVDGILKINKANIESVNASAIVSHSITTDQLTTENLSGEHGWINLSNGTFNYGDGKFSWNGHNLSIKGNGEFSGQIISTYGKIGKCYINNNILFCLKNNDISSTNTDPLISAGMGDSKYAFWAGGSGMAVIEEGTPSVGGDSSYTVPTLISNYDPDIENAPFRVTYDGKVYLDNGEIIASSITAKEKYQISCLVKDHDETQDNYLLPESFISGYSYKYHDYKSKELYKYNRNIIISSPIETEIDELGDKNEITPSATISLESRRINGEDQGTSYIDLSATNIITHCDLYLGDEVFDKKTFTLHGNVDGNASTATKLLWPHTFKIGNTGKMFDGTNAVSWSLNEIGAAAKNHTHSASDVGAAPSSHTHSTLNANDYNLIFTTAQNFYAKKGDALANGVVNLGASTARFKTLYLTGSVNSSSDRNDKHDILDLDERYENMYMDLRPVTYMWNKLSDEDDSTHDRVHCGLIAQEVNAAAIKNGLSSKLFAGICKDKLDAPLSDGRSERWGLAYNEFTAITIKMVQKAIRNTSKLEAELNILKDENQILKERLKNIEQTISDLKSK